MKRNNRFRWGIFAKLSVTFILAGLVPLLLLSVFFLEELTDNVNSIILDNARMVLEASGQSVDHVLKGWKESMVSVYDMDDDTGYSLSETVMDRTMPVSEKRILIHRLLNAIVPVDGLKSVRFLDKYGNLYYVSQTVGKVQNARIMLQWKEREMEERYTGHMMQTDGVHVDDYFTNINDKVITIRQNLFDVTGIRNVDDFLGTLYFDVGIDIISYQFAGMNLGDNSGFYVADESGEDLYYSSDLTEIPEEYAGRFQEVEGRSGILQGGDDYYLYRKNTECGWISILRIYRGDILENVRKTRQYILTVLLASSGFLLVLYFGFSRRISQPIWRLKRGMEQIEEGDLTARIEIRSNDEISVLADGLNQMASQLAVYIDRVYGAEIRQKDAELNALKSQIKPHYLYNTLDIIRMTAIRHSDRETAEMIESLARQLRYLMGEERELVPLEREIANIQDYFQIVRIRYEGRIGLSVSVPDALQKTAILKLILQPVVENAVKHGFREKERAGSIWISAALRDQCLEMTVMDDGEGMDEETLSSMKMHLAEGTRAVKEPERGGVGIVNVNERIRNYYGSGYGIQAESTKGTGTIIMIRVPCVKGGTEDV